MLSRRIGFAWILRVCQASTSNSSSKVPKPPGSAMKASAFSPMSALRVCMVLGDVQLGDAVVSDLEIDEHLGDDADDLSAGSQGCFGDGLHEADVGAAVDEADVASGESAAEFFGSGLVDGMAPSAEAQKTAMLRIIETRISSALQMDDANRRQRKEADRSFTADDRPEGTGRTWACTALGKSLVNDDRGAVVIADDLFDERAGCMIRSSGVGDDTCTDRQVQADRFARIKRHDLIAHLDLQRSRSRCAD